MSKANICIIGLSKQFTDDVGKQLSIKMDMFYANVQEIIEFELMDISNVEKICGVDYLLKEEKSIIKRLCTYDNTIINLQYSNLNQEENLEFVKNNCLIIYLRMSEKRYLQELEKDNVTSNEKSIDKDVFYDRDYICGKMADITVNCEQYNNKELTDIIIEQILRFYTN